MNKTTQEDYIKKCSAIHNGAYNYDKVVYTKAHDKVTITCAKHGEFTTKAYSHLQGKGCTQCGYDKLSRERLIGQDEFIRLCKERHGDRYLYDKVVYKGNKHKVTITCREHGDFTQLPLSHRSGKGCERCARILVGDKIGMSDEEIITKATEKHSGRYTYDKVINNRNSTRKRIVVVCSKHGKFEQNAAAHIRGAGCPKCKGDEARIRKLGNKESFVEAANRIHCGNYSYEKTVYTHSRAEVIITCKRHGDFTQKPSEHLMGCGCSVCGNEYKSLTTRSNTEDFIEKSIKIHGDRYDYSKVDYHRSKDPVTIICAVHGEFEQMPNGHLGGQGCPTCGRTYSANEASIVDFLEEFTKVLRRDRLTLDGLEIDVLLPDFGVGIEYNGSIWHSERFHPDPIRHMRKKQIAAKEKGTRLIHVSDKSDITIVKKTLAHILGINDEKYFARKCQTGIGKSTDPEIRKFFEENHLQGNAEGCWVGYLTINSQIVCAMSFSLTSSERGNTDFTRYELRRFASVCRVAGGASRLLKMFIREHHGCASIISYSDNAWFTGEMYAALGFSMVKEVRPEYIYIKGSKVRKKGQMKREVMAKLEGFDFNPDESEHQNALRNNWYRLYDCGKKKWELKVK